MSEIVTEKDWLEEAEFSKIVADRLASFNDSGPAVTTEETPDVVAGDSVTTTQNAPAVKEEADGPLRGPDGKFVSKTAETDNETEDEEQETDEVADETDQPSEEDTWTIETDDPQLQSLLAKYDNDPVKALRAAAEAQSEIGRKGSELGELRKALADERAHTEELFKQMQVQMAATLTPQPDIEDDPKAAAEAALTRGDYETLVAAVTAWKDGTEFTEPDPFGAAVFWTNLQQQYAADQAAAARAETETATPARATTDEDAAIAPVLQRNPDLETYLPEIGKVANEKPLLKRALEEGSPEEKAEALESLYVIAKSRLGADTSRTAVQEAAVRASEDARQARRSATVVSARRSSAASDDRPTRTDQFKQSFRAHMGLPLDD